MPDQNKCTAVEEAAEEIRRLSRDLDRVADQIRERLQRLANTLTPSRYEELMREGWAPWNAETHLHSTIQALVDDDDFLVVEDLPGALIEAARVTDEALMEDFLEKQWKEFQARHPSSQLPEPGGTPAEVDPAEGDPVEGDPQERR